jgi:hypothetical protein
VVEQNCLSRDRGGSSWVCRRYGNMLSVRLRTVLQGMARHMKSLRSLQRDGGWIHTLLEEAENERMHLLTFLKLKNPSYPFRAAVLLTQVQTVARFDFCSFKTSGSVFQCILFLLPSITPHLSSICRVS